jgi:hypothetical protein
MTKNMNSGSYFLQSLLDGHNDIFVIPMIFEKTFLRDYEDKIYWSVDFAQIFFSFYFRPMMTLANFQKDGDLSSSALSIARSLEQKFSKEVRTTLYNAMVHRIGKYQCRGNGFELFLRTFIELYQLVIYGRVINTPYVLIPLHNMLTELSPWSKHCGYAGPSKSIDDPRSFIHFLANNTYCKLLHITRDPRANYASGIYAKNHGGRSPVETFLEVYREYYNGILPLASKLGTHKFFVIANEKIHLNPVVELESLCRFLSVRFTPETFFTSTIDGISWSGNSHFGTIDTFDPSLRSSRQWIQRLKISELAVLSYIFKPMIDDYGVPDLYPDVAPAISKAHIIDFMSSEIKLSRLHADVLGLRV